MLFAVLALTGLVAVAVAGDEKSDKDKTKQEKLAVGDAAPALKATKWLQGDEVKEFKKDRIYVVEFWATWCGPCIVMMPHMAELQQHYKKDVTFIGFSAKDPNNTQEKVVEFVKKRGPKLKYTFAFEDGRDTYGAWMTAAGQGGIPCSFVVDKKGKIAYIGHPMYLDVVLPKVVSGKWDYKEGPEELKGIEKEVNELFQALRGKDAEETLEKIATFEKKHPALANIPYFTGPKLSLLVKAKKTDQAKKMAEKVIETASKHDDTSALATVAANLRTDEAKKSKELLDLSLKAAKALLKAAGEKDLMALYTMAETHFARGERDKAKEFCKKAIDAAPDARTKKFLENRLKVYEDDTKKD
jgi:thiol-disulfide isomerase/thioredoxin